MTQFSSNSTSPNSSVPMIENGANGDRSIAEDSSVALQPEVDESPEAIEPAQTAEARAPWGPIEWWQGVSVRRKATALAIGLGIVPVLAVSGASTHYVNQALDFRERQEQKTRAIALSHDLSEITAQRYQMTQDLARTPFLADSRLRNQLSFQQQQQYFQQFLRQGVNSIVIIDARTGNALVEAREAGQVATIPNYKEIDYFQEVVRTKQPAISPVRRSRATNDLSFFVAVPVFDRATGELLYVIRTRTPTRYISEQLQNSIKTRSQQVGDPEAPSYFIADNQGRVFVSSNSEAIEQPIDKIFPAFGQLDQAGQTDLAVDQNALDSQEYLVGYAPLQQTQELPDTDWSVLVAENADDAFNAQRRLLLGVVLGLGLTMLAVSALAANLADRATRPIVAAAEAVEKIGQGDLDTRLDLEGKDEVGVLGTNINTMAAQLQSSLTAQAFETERERIITAVKGSGVLRREDLPDIFDQAVAAVRELFNLERVVIYRFNAGTGRSVIAESVAPGWPSALELSVKDACISSGLCDAYRHGRVMATNDIAEAGLHPEHMKLMEELQIKANLVVPIMASNELFGLLIAHSCATTREWQEFEIYFLQRLGIEIGLTIYRVNLLEQTAALAEEQRQLREGLQKRALELLQEVDPISRGDLTTRAKVTADEIGTIADSYNATVDNLRKIVLQVQSAANQVVTTTSENESSVQTLSTEALRQAEEVKAALKLVQDMADAVQAVAGNAEQARAAVEQAAQTVEEGDVVMNRTVEGIQGIRVTVADTAKKVKHLGESSQKISKVVELISAFAAQTNMLALNASIEASRAGEEGKGFAVVANEVRNLARQSAEATEEIRALVASIQIETNEVVGAMELGIEQVVTGTQLVDETRQSLNKITAVSSEISELVEAIAQSAIMQSQTSKTVSQTMQDVTTIANKTSAEATQVSLTFEQLRQVARMLQADVGQFKV